MKKKVILFLVIVAIEALAFYIVIPPINLQSLGFWHFAAFCIAPFLAWYLIKGNYDAFKSKKKLLVNKATRNVVIVCVVYALILLLADFVGTPMFGGMNAYRNRITISGQSDFNEIEEFDMTQVQIIDKDVSMSLADRIFGELGAETVSMYQVSDIYSSSVLNNTMYRMTPADYNGFIKWMSTKDEGTPGYISVNVTDGETVFHKTISGLKYTPSAFFNYDLSRHLRFNYPTYIFGRTSFECDDENNPYWITQVMSCHFVGKAEDVKGVVVTDPMTGKCTYYAKQEVPHWVDNVYDARLISSQYNSYGRYINGFFNFSNKGMTATTDDYAYLQKDGHLWMYTGVTSVGKDESNIGFIYVDLQNKNVIYIVSAGAEEYSARSSAEGALQEKGYTSIFPTMVNISGNPVYFMGLKDNGGLIKAYAFVDYKDYQKVGVGDTVKEALKNFDSKNIYSSNDNKEISIVVEDIQTAVVDGYSIYFIKSMDNNYYSCSIEVSDRLPFVKAGDELKLVVNNNLILEIK